MVYVTRQTISNCEVEKLIQEFYHTIALTKAFNTDLNEFLNL